jgi:hypothetical protein
MDFDALTKKLCVKNGELDFDIKSFPEDSLGAFLAEYIPTGKLVVRNITRDDRNEQNKTITIKGTGFSQPFAEMTVTVVFSVRVNPESGKEFAAILIEGTNRVWDWSKTFPPLRDTWLSTMEAIQVEGTADPRLVLRSCDAGENAKRGLHFEGQFTPKFLSGLQSFLPGQQQRLTGSIEMVSADRSLNEYQLTRLPAVALSGPQIDLKLLESGFPLSFSELTYSLHCRPYLDLAQICWSYRSFLVIKGAIQFAARGKKYSIPLSASVYDTSGAVLITAAPAEAVQGLLTEIGGLVGMSLSAPNGIVGAADLLRLTEIKVLVDPGAEVKIAYVTCHLETGENIRWTLIPGFLTLDAVDLDFRIDRPFGPRPHIGVVVSGLLGIGEQAALELSAYFDHDSSGNNVVFGGTLKHGPLNVREVFRRFLGYENRDLPDLHVDNFNFLIEPSTKIYSAEIALSGEWKLQGPSGFVVRLSYLHFRLMSQGEAGAEVEIRALFDVYGCTLYVTAAHEGVDKGWTFRGGTSKGNPVPVGIGIEKFVQAIDGSLTVPEMVKSLSLQDLEVVFNTLTSDFSFRALVSFPVEGNPTKSGDAALIVHLNFTKEPVAPSDKPKHALNVGGVLHLCDHTFAVSYGSHGNTSLLVAAYDNPKGDTIPVKELVSQVSRKVADLIPSGLTINLKHAQLAFGKWSEKKQGEERPTEKSKFLFGMELDAGIELSQLPLVGFAFDRSQTLSVAFQLLAVTDKFAVEEVREINRLTAAGVTKLTENEIDTAQGNVQMKATLRLGEISRQLDLPLKTGVKDLAEKEQRGEPTSADIVSTASTRMVKWVDVQKAFGPFHFQRVGVGLNGQNIEFLLDASLDMAGLTITLEGLAAECALSELSKGNFKPAFHLDGLGVNFVRGDLKIGGALLCVKEVKEEHYDGALTVQYKKLGIQAFGSYSSEVGGHPSLFVYALVDYPIGGPPFFYVEGLALGFGYNRTIKLPTIDEVSEFPLVKHAMAKPAQPLTPMRVVADLGEKIPRAVGEYFLTAGVRFTSFKNINGFVLLTALFGKHFEIDVLGKATLSSPPNVDKPLVSASLALLARFAPDEGELKVIAKLLPDAYVFSRDCHLTGGFAFYCWFEKEHKGDFVLTLGGYHKDFEKPAHYPQVPRLGLNWQVNPNLKMTADAYFALTPSALMAGGNLAIVWQSGNLKAWFTAGVDFLIGWQPFHYSGHVGVSIGASYTFKFFGWRTVSVELAADLKVWGPPFSGIAHVNWYIVSFDVAFGNSEENTTDPIKEWSDFQKAFLPTNDGICTIAAHAGMVASHGSQPANDKPSADQPTHLGVINPRQLSIVVNSAVPITESSGGLLEQLPISSALGVAPMNKKSSDWSCKYTIKIERVINENREPVNDQFIASAIKQSVPEALWDQEMDPRRRSEKRSKGLIDGAVCGYEIHLKKPLLEDSLKQKLSPTVNDNVCDLSVTSAGGCRLDFNPAQTAVRETIKNTVQQPETRRQRQEVLSDLLAEFDIDWSGVTVESWRAAPKLVAVA